MFVRSSLTIATVLCAQGLFACSGEDPSELGAPLGETQQAFNVPWSGPMSGFFSQASAVTSRNMGLLDLFVKSGTSSRPHNVDFYRYTSSTGWLAGVDLGYPFVSYGTIAVTVNGGRLDLFVAAANGFVYHKFSNQTQGAPTWSEWFQVPDVLVKNPSGPDAITVTSWGQGRLDLFWVTPAGNIGHKWAHNYVWQGTETGDTPATWYLQAPAGQVYSPPIESVSTQFGRLDVVVGHASNFPGLKHHAYYGDGTGWQPRVVQACCEYEGGTFNLDDFVLTRATGTSFSAYAKNLPASRIEQLLWQGSWYSPGNFIFSFDSSPVVSGLGAVSLNDGVRWFDGANTRVDLFGWHDSTQDLAWQMWIQ